MAIFDTISFPDYDVVSGFVTVDGWPGDLDPGLTLVNFPDSGYAEAGKLTFSGGAQFPPVVFHALRADLPKPANIPGTNPPVPMPGSNPPVAPGSYLVMGFFCSFDPTFDSADGITLAFLPDFNTKTHTTARRIDLLPNTDGVGAGAPGGGYMNTGFDWFPPETPPANPPPGAHPTYYSRKERDLPGLQFWKGIGTNPPPPDTNPRWQSIAVNNVYAKASSWIPSTVVTTAAPSQTVPTTGPGSASAAFTLQVASVAQFPESGDLLVPIAGGSSVTVAYTGRNTGTNTFTGCKVPKNTTGGTVSTTSNAVQLLDVGWGVEVVIPTTTALGGTDWINLQGHFGLYVNLFRFSHWEPQPPATPHAGYYAAQYRFPLPYSNAADQHFLAGTLNDIPYIGDDWYGKATIPSITGVNDAIGVAFENVNDPRQSIGVRHPSTGNTLTSELYGVTGTEDNTLVARLRNTDPANGANDVTAEFRFAKWGIPSAAFGEWDPASAHGAQPATHINLGASGTGEITQLWRHQDVPSDYAVSTVWPGHHCIWVRLDSTSNVNFVESGVRGNMNFTHLSEHEADATISGSGYPPPSVGSDHEFVLFSHVRSMWTYEDEEAVAIASVGPEGGRRGRQVWYWLVQTFRKTGLEFTVGDTTGEVLDPSPGEFGHIAEHSGAASDIFVSELYGGGLKRHGKVQLLRVPHDGEVRIHTWVGAGPPGKVKRGADPWWLLLWQLLKRLWAWIKKKLGL